MADKYLAAPGWNDVCKREGVKDNGLAKALAAYAKLGDKSDPQTRIDGLDEISDLAGKLERAKDVAASDEALEHLDKVEKAAAKVRAELVKEQKGAAGQTAAALAQCCKLWQRAMSETSKGLDELEDIVADVLDEPDGVSSKDVKKNVSEIEKLNLQVKVKLDAAAKAKNADEKAKLGDEVEDLLGASSLQMMQLQMAMQRHDQAMQTMSNLLKANAKTSKEIISNIR